MPRPEDVEIAKAMKEAAAGVPDETHTAEDIVTSWGLQRPGASIDRTYEMLRLFIDKKPEMIATFAGNQLAQVVDRGVLDRKTRHLVIIGVYMALRHWEGIGAQCCNAKAAGATDAEIMEVAFLANYGASKTWLVEICQALTSAFETENYKNVQSV